MNLLLSPGIGDFHDDPAKEEVSLQLYLPWHP